jgi:CheY-like chemotaxis protein
MTRTLRLLIVDDNARVRRTIREVVSGLSPAVEECSDGDEVLARFEAFAPDFVLMDLRMARVDGIAAAAALHAAHPDARIIAVSDHDQDDVRRAAREAGMEAFVAKSDLLQLRRILTASTGRTGP